MRCRNEIRHEDDVRGNDALDLVLEHGHEEEADEEKSLRRGGLRRSIARGGPPPPEEDGRISNSTNSSRKGEDSELHVPPKIVTVQSKPVMSASDLGLD